MNVIVDTNVLIALLRKEPDLVVARHAAAYQRGGRKFLMCPTVYFEYRRGTLVAGRDHDGRARAFDRFVANECLWIEFSQGVAQKASWLWSRHRGETAGDADLIVTATALVNHLPVATRNTSHIARFGVEALDWFQERPKAFKTRRVR